MIEYPDNGKKIDHIIASLLCHFIDNIESNMCVFAKSDKLASEALGIDRASLRFVCAYLEGTQLMHSRRGSGRYMHATKYWDNKDYYDQLCEEKGQCLLLVLLRLSLSPSKYYVWSCMTESGARIIKSTTPSLAELPGKRISNITFLYIEVK